jgi:hypothetical protein
MLDRLYGPTLAMTGSAKQSDEEASLCAVRVDGTVGLSDHGHGVSVRQKAVRVM